MNSPPCIIAVVPVHNGRDATLAFLESMAGVIWRHLERYLPFLAVRYARLAYSLFRRRFVDRTRR